MKEIYFNVYQRMLVRPKTRLFEIASNWTYLGERAFEFVGKRLLQQRTQQLVSKCEKK